VKLNQVIAIEKGIKTSTKDVIDSEYKAIAHPNLFDGFHKRYKPLAEGGETFPPETKVVQKRAEQSLRLVTDAWTKLFDVTAQKDYANCAARADVVVDGKPLLTGVPVTYLLFLEKQLVDLRSFVTRLPALDTSETWTHDVNQGLYVAPVSQTHRTKKVQKALVLYPATDKHAAQTQLITEDEVVGHWDQTKFSAAIAAPEKERLLGRIDQVITAVKVAREAANSADAPPVYVGSAVLGWITGK
jgi:hypothetical protein